VNLMTESFFTVQKGLRSPHHCYNHPQLNHELFSSQHGRP
jgi:hypothetical protein